MNNIYDINLFFNKKNLTCSVKLNIQNTKF
jgi:hypothetical protein